MLKATSLNSVGGTGAASGEARIRSVSCLVLEVGLTLVTVTCNSVLRYCFDDKYPVLMIDGIRRS